MGKEFFFVNKDIENSQPITIGVKLKHVLGLSLKFQVNQKFTDVERINRDNKNGKTNNKEMDEFYYERYCHWSNCK